MRETLKALRDVLRNPALRRLQVAWAASMTGNVAFLVTLSVVAYRHGGGATGVGLLMLLRMGVSAAFAPFTAIIADRGSRRRVMVTTDLIRAALVLCLAWEVRDSAGVVVIFARSRARRRSSRPPTRSPSRSRARRSSSDRGSGACCSP